MYHLQCIKGKRQGLSLLGTNVAKGRSQRSPMGQLRPCGSSRGNLCQSRATGGSHKLEKSCSILIFVAKHIAWIETYETHFYIFFLSMLAWSFMKCQVFVDVFCIDLDFAKDKN